METQAPANKGTGQSMDDAAGFDRLLAMLESDQLAARIEQAARLAMVKHLVGTAQDIQSAVEAEPSTT